LPQLETFGTIFRAKPYVFLHRHWDYDRTNRQFCFWFTRNGGLSFYLYDGYEKPVRALCKSL